MPVCCVRNSSEGPKSPNIGNKLDSGTGLVISGDVSNCGLGTTIGSGVSCDIVCDAGFEQKSSGKSVLKCEANGEDMKAYPEWPTCRRAQLLISLLMVLPRILTGALCLCSMQPEQL